MSLKFRTPLAPGLFEGTQLGLVSSNTPLGDIRLQLENEDEVLIARGDEVFVVEVEEDEDNRQPGAYGQK